MLFFTTILSSMIFAALNLFSNDFLSNSKKDWENQQVFGINKEKPHAFFIPYKDIESAKTHDAAKSEYYKSLNGKWKFKLVNTVEKTTNNFADNEFNDKNWNEIKVPSNWQCEG